MSRLTLSKAFRIAGVALALVVGTGPAFAQMPYGQERARAVGELTLDGIATALREEGSLVDVKSDGIWHWRYGDLLARSKGCGVLNSARPN